MTQKGQQGAKKVVKEKLTIDTFRKKTRTLIRFLKKGSSKIFFKFKTKVPNNLEKKFNLKNIMIKCFK